MYYATFRQFLTIKTIEERYKNVQYSPMIFNNYFIVLLIPDLELFRGNDIIKDFVISIEHDKLPRIENETD